MKIGLFTDSHYSTVEQYGSRRPTLSYGKIQQAMEAFSDAGADLVICLGDLADHCKEPEECIEVTTRISEMIHSYGIPFYCVMGNHDGDMFTREEFRQYTGNAYPPFYELREGKMLVFLDANYNDDGSSYEPGKIDWTNTYIPESQIGQLKEVLAQAKEAYVFIHENLDPDVEEHHIVHNAAEVRKVLRDSGVVKKVIQGHYHWGHENKIDGILYHTLPAMCEGEKNYFEIMKI